MSIPATFKLVNRTYKVEPMTEDTHSIANVWGACSASEARIQLYSTEETDPDLLLHTFYHELFHALFEAAGRSDLSSNEDFVDLMGGLLHQYLQSKRGKFE